MAGEREAVKSAVAFALANATGFSADVVIEPVSLQVRDTGTPVVFLRTPQDRLRTAYDCPRRDDRVFTLELICAQDFPASETMPTVGSVDDLADQVQEIVESLIPALMDQDLMPPTASFLIDWNYVETARIIDSAGNRHRAAAVVRYDVGYRHWYLNPDDFEALEFGTIEHDLAETTVTPPDATDEIEFEQ